MKGRTKIGQFMYNFTDKVCKKIMKHKWLIYLLNYTWGILTTIAGWVMYGFCLLFLRKHIGEKGKFMHCHYLTIFDRWGGLEMGINFFTDKTPSLHTQCHECGHTIQNALYGPLFIFLIAIPSAIRYWYRELYTRKHKQDPNFYLPSYNLIWFEGSASDLGTYYHNNFKK